MTSYAERILFWQVVLFLTSVSAVCSLLIIIFVLWYLRKDWSSRLIMYLAIADFGLTIICMALCGFNLHNGDIPPPTHLACQIQPFITWYFMEASILWLSTIAVCSFMIIKFNKELSLVEEIVANCINWGVPFVTSILPLINGTGEAYGDRTNLWCTFSENQKEAQMLNISIYYGVNLIVIISCYAFILFTVIRSGKNRIDDDVTRKKMIVIRRLFLFVLCYFVVWTPLVVCYIWEFVVGRYISFAVELAVDNLLHVQPILNGGIYGYFVIMRYFRVKRSDSSKFTDRSSIELSA